MSLAALEMEPSEEEDFRPLVVQRSISNVITGSNGSATMSNVSSTHTGSSFSSLSSSRRRNIFSIMLILLVMLVFLFLIQVYQTVTTQTSPSSSSSNGGSFVSKKQIDPHSGKSFGGIDNVAQPAGAKAAAAVQQQQQQQEGGDATSMFREIVIPKSNVGHAIPSLNAANVLNLWGHYVHDEHRSPYASHLYDKPIQVLEKKQALFVQKMQKIRKEWGAWSFQDPQQQQQQQTSTNQDENDNNFFFDRPIADFTNVEYKDLPSEDFPQYSWQADEEYVTAFLQQARALVSRMTEGIYAEYGWSKKDIADRNQDLEKREEAFRVHILSSKQNQKETMKTGIAQLSQVAMDALVRKLLHTMMTNDEFYVVLAGHSAAAGHGNDFQQNRIMTFHRIMEPVFDKLGMTLVSRNMGMGGVGTLQFSLGGGDFYGETDILEWDSGMTEKGPAVDLFNKQAILSGERVPVIFSEYHFNVLAETDGMAWMGKSISDLSMMAETTLENQASIPYAVRWMKTKEEKYNAICWEPRSDFKPSNTQAAHPGSQVGWHPGFRHHQWSGRRLALVVLKALSMAFDLWEEGTKKEGFPLADSYWHIGDQYRLIRNNLRTHVTTPKATGGGDIRSHCEQLIPYLPRICRVQMHGFGLWTPQAHQEYSLLNIIQPALNGYKPYFKTRNLYKGFDLLPYKQAIPDGEVDVHAIAIATTHAAPKLDHRWIEDDDNDNILPDEGATGKNEATPSTVVALDSPMTRRRLRDASNQVFRAAARLEQMLSIQSPTAKMFVKDYHRRLGATDDDDAVVPGLGWELHGWTVVDGFCDGSAQSECKRDRSNDCLLYGANDNHLDVHGNSLSGWLVFQIPKVREGIILARMEWWCGSEKANSLTAHWTEVNNGKTLDTTPWKNPQNHSAGGSGQRHRTLKKLTHDDKVPADFEMDIAINGKITQSMQRKEWLGHTVEIVKNVAVFPLLNDESMSQRDWEGEAMEAAIRFRSKLKPKQTFCVSHVYYA